MVVTGNKSHWKIIHKYLSFPNFGGRGGKRIIDRTAVDTRPTIEKVIIIRAIKGRLKDRIVLLNSDPPTITGSHPSKNIIKALVAQE